MSGETQLGVKLPHTGAVVASGSVPARARELEEAGFDSLWVSDHVVLPNVMASHYPFAADGRATWPSDTPYLESVVVLAAAAAATTRVRLGTAVLVLPQRNPVLLAKQIASVAQIAGGRVELGVGAGWLREEFDALDAPFEGRGARMLEWIDVMRACWTGRPAEFSGEHYHLPPDLFALPTPPSPVPLYVGGHSPRALRRAGTIGDGWLGQQSVRELDLETLAAEVGAVRSAAAAAGRDPRAARIVLRLVDSVGRAGSVASRLGDLVKAGVDEVIVDVDPAGGDPVADHAVLRDAAASLRTEKLVGTAAIPTLFTNFSGRPRGVRPRASHEDVTAPWRLAGSRVSSAASLSCLGSSRG
jgi:probable F420-dependent oxidoreductase